MILGSIKVLSRIMKINNTVVFREIIQGLRYLPYAQSTPVQCLALHRISQDLPGVMPKQRVRSTP